VSEPSTAVLRDWVVTFESNYDRFVDSMSFTISRKCRTKGDLSVIKFGGELIRSFLKVSDLLLELSDSIDIRVGWDLDARTDDEFVGVWVRVIEQELIVLENIVFVNVHVINSLSF
jgi:hypothetical protein